MSRADHQFSILMAAFAEFQGTGGLLSQLPPLCGCSSRQFGDGDFSSPESNVCDGDVWFAIPIDAPCAS
jgi:hypothetical protein